ncbi:hypothetical protein GCM10009838_66150 [Catenulispora subtropica]|uniref:DUF998 domain-containing protein n=2 Tax=Catenulispora subtropica TaxID=450798 RepID=A0ABN2SVU0_9ACTN
MRVLRREASGARWRLGGPVFVAGFIASLVMGAALASTSLFLPGASGPELRGYYGGSGTAVTVSAVLQLVAAVGLLWFGRGASAAVGGGQRAERATWLATFGFAVSSVLSLVLLGIAGSASNGTLVFVGRLTLAFGGPVHLFGLAGLLWFVSRGARGDDRTPRWVWRFGAVVAPLMLLSVVSIAAPPLVRVEPLWRLLSAIWVITVCLRATAGRKDADDGLRGLSLVVREGIPS